jgi:PAS domain S-box-containing protein
MINATIDIGVLYVEDDSQSAESVANVLKEFADPFYFAVDGFEGLEMFKKYRPKIVISDIQMPKMNGLEMLKAIKEIDPRVVIYLTTAYSDEKYTIPAIELRVNGFFLKPLNLTKLVEDLALINNQLELRAKYNETKKLLEQYQMAIDSVMIVSKTDKRGNFTYVNDNFCEISGYAKKELIGSSHEILRHPATQSGVFKTLWHEIQMGKIWQGTLQKRKKDGSSFYVKSMIVPLTHDDAQIYEYIAIMWDVSQQVEQERELEKFRLKERFEHINKAIDIGAKTNMSSLPLMAFETSNEGTVLSASPKLLQAVDPLGVENLELAIESKKLSIASLLKLIDKEIKRFNSVEELIELVNIFAPFAISFGALDDKKESYELVVQSNTKEDKKYFLFFILPLA